MDEDLKEFCTQAYTTLEGAVLTGDADNHCIELVYRSFKDYIRVSYGEDNIILVSDYYPKEFNCGNADYCVDAYIMSIIRSYKKCSLSNTVQSTLENDLCDDEIDDTFVEDKHKFSALNIDKITSDLSTIVVSKLVFEENLIGYRFRLNNGCLDISIEKGKDLGIVPYKIGKRVQLSSTNGVLVSKYECNNKVLFPDISNDDELCRKLLQALLS